MRIEELMNRFPATCGPNDTLREAQQKMQGGNCEFLPVTAGRGSQCLIGVITDGDIRMAGQLGGRSLEELRVKDAMAKKVYTCNLGDSLAEAQATMQEAGIRRLPVVDESGRLLGVLSLANVAYEAERERVPERGLSSPWREKDLSAREWRDPLTRETHRRPRGDARREDAGEPARGRPRYLGNQWRNEA